MPSRLKLNVFVILAVGIGMPAYYKIKFLILGLVTWKDIFHWTLPLEFFFGLALAAIVVLVHDQVVKILRRVFSEESRNLMRFVVQYSISTITAIAMAVIFSIVFWDFVMNMPITAEYLFDYALLGLLIPLLVNGISESLFFYGRWEKESAEKEKLAKENIKAKYEVLQQQVNPHFLFNCFNTLGILIKESKKTASDFLQQLSNVYRYVLEIKDLELVSLKTELEALQSYASLMKHRFGETFHLILDVNPNDELYLPPLTLQMLMENALKHNRFSRDTPLDITLKMEDDYLKFNNMAIPTRQEVAGTKTGLRNLSERYKMLSGKGIEINDGENYFSVIVPLLKIENA